MSVKYLVSGGEGALGKTVISMLLQRGEKVRILMSELSDTRIYRNNPNIEICYGISTDKDSMREFFELDDPRSAVLFHTDEYVSLTDATNLTMRRVNVIGAENIVDMCLKRKVGKLVYLSSAYALNPEVSGDSITIHFDRNKVEGEYAKSKAEAAAYVMEKVALNRLNAVMVLPTFIIGPGYSQDYEINKVLNSYLNNGTIPPKGGGRAFVDVRDVANAMLTLADKGEPGAGYIVSGDYKTSDEFFKDVNDIQGIEAPVKTASKLVMSKSLAKLVDFYYKITHKENPREAYTLFSENPDARFEDNSKGILPETTISFKESLNDTIKGAQQGGIQAAAAVAPKSDKKSSDMPQGKSDKKTSAEAMEARLKQTQAVTSKAGAATQVPAKSAFARPAAAAAEAKAAAEAGKEEEVKSIIPQSTLKDPEMEPKAEPKTNSESAFRFGGTPTKFTKAEVPLKSEPAKPVTPPEAPKSEPVKSIIPPRTPAAEAPKSAPAPSSGFPRAAATPSSAPAAPKAAEPKAAEAPKTERPASTGFPRAAATPSSGFPRAAATPSSGFPRAAATPSSAPAAPKAAEPKPAESKAAEAPKAEEGPRTGRPGSTGFPRAAATPSSAPAAPKAAEPKPAEPKAAEAPKTERPASTGFPRAAATPSSGFPRAAATPSSGFPRAAATPSSAPVAPKAAEPKPAEPKASEPKAAETPKTERSASTGFPRATATPSSGFTKPAATLSSSPAAKKEPTLGSGPFLGDETKLGGSSFGGGSLGGSTLGGGSLGGGSLGGGSLGGSTLGGSLGGDPALEGGETLGGGETLHSDSSKQSINYAFMSAQAEHNPFKPATSSDPSPFKAAQPAQSAAPSGPFKPAQSSEPSPFKPAQAAAPASAPKSAPASGPINSAFKPAESSAPAPRPEPAFSREPAISSFSEADLSELEDEIDKFGIPTGPVVPPGIFAPPPKSGRD